MKIKAIERRKMSISNSEYENIYKAMNNPRTYFCKINGNDYYLAEVNMISSKLYEVVFVSHKIAHEMPYMACCAWFMDNVICGDKTTEDCTEYVPCDEEKGGAE